jgi:hypothetical protein
MESIDNPNCAVFVSNIGPNAGENTIAEFFSFCGRIEALSLTTLPDGTKQAVVVFDSPKSARTALILNNSLIYERTISVLPAQAQPQVEIPAPSETPNPHIEKANQSPLPENATHAIASMLAAGYKLSQDALEKAKALDESVGFSDKVSATFKQGVEKVKGKVDQIDEKLGLSVKAQIVKDTIQLTATGVDEKLGITNKAKVVAHTFTGIAATIGEVFENVADKTKAFVESNPTLSSGVNKLKSLSQNVDSTVEGIESETKKLIEEQHKRDHPELYQQQAQQSAEGAPTPMPEDQQQAQQSTSTDSVPNTTQQ